MFRRIHGMGLLENNRLDRGSLGGYSYKFNTLENHPDGK